VTELHDCEGELPKDGYGQAVSSCGENEDGSLWVSNDEYASQVNFCPYCGFKAKVQLQKVPGQIFYNGIQEYVWK
jgi:hypothetical protein